LRLVVFCSIEIAGDRTLDMLDIGFCSHLEKLPRIGRLRLSNSAAALRHRMVSKASDDLPLRAVPVITINLSARQIDI